MKSDARLNAKNYMQVKMSKQIIFAATVLFLLSCASRRQADVIIGHWDVTAMNFPETTVGMAQQKQIDPIIPSLNYEFKTDSTYYIMSDRLSKPTAGTWSRSDDQTLILKTNNGIVTEFKCDESNRDALHCSFYNPEIGTITIDLTRLDP